MTTQSTRALAAAVTAASALVAAAPATAQTGGFACSASAITATVLGSEMEPVKAGSADSCTSSAQSLERLPAPLGGHSASAQTGMVGDRAGAATWVRGLQVGSLSGIALPQIALPAGLDALPVPLPAAAQLLGLPALLNVDATQAAQELVSQRVLPDIPLLGADLVQTAVAGACRTGSALLDSLAVVEGLTALGQALPTDRPIDTAVPLLGAETVDFSQLDVAGIALPSGLSIADPVVGPLLRTALQSAVASLPEVSVPEAVGRVVIEPARKEEGASALRQLGPRVKISVLGNEIADVTLGDALVSALGVVCAQPAVENPAPAPPAEQPDVVEEALSCATSDVVLTDVVEKDGKVKLVGIAAGRFVGRSVDLVLTDTGKRVGTAVVQPDGYFRTRAPLPSKRIRWTNRARYQAVIDGERSMALKLHRRMRISRMKPTDGRITITGRIYGRMAEDEVVISRRESCTRDVEVTTVKPDRDGRWRVTLPVPEGLEAATYRATAKVRKGDNPKRFRTFTLPGHVAL